MLSRRSLFFGGAAVAATSVVPQTKSAKAEQPKKLDKGATRVNENGALEVWDGEKEWIDTSLRFSNTMLHERGIGDKPQITSFVIGENQFRHYEPLPAPDIIYDNIEK